MKPTNNLAILPAEGQDTSHKDGEDSDPAPFQLTIDVVDNGYILTRNDAEDPSQKVFLFNGMGDSGPKAMIQEVIELLGLVDKVKLVK
jgi:hypothetical protein